MALDRIIPSAFRKDVPQPVEIGDAMYFDSWALVQVK
jgi:hypothetical protein